MAYGNASPVESLDRLQEQSGGQIVDGTVGTFVREKVYSEKLSTDAGEPVYMLHDFCDIRVPGNARGNHRSLVRKTFPDGREVMVNDYHTRKYGRAWDAFLRGEDLRPEGTPLDECPDIPRERLAALKTAEVRTVEELAGLPERSLQRIGMDGRALQSAAKAYLEEHSQAARAVEEVATLRAELAAMKADMQGVTHHGDDKGASPKRSRRGRDQPTV